MTAEEDKAREEAEARRQRILKGGEDRLGVVTGEVPTSGASRLAAMRKRRFKKASSETKETKAEETPAPESEATPEEPKPAVVEEVVEKPEVVEEKPVEPVEEKATEEEAASTDEPKRKYQGVAKMRRRMIKERQQQNEGDAPSTSASGTTASTTSAASATTTTTAPALPKKKAIFHTLPIIMHAVVVLLLFVAGLDIGLQQGQVDYGANKFVVVHKEVAPRSKMLILEYNPFRKTPPPVEPILGESDYVVTDSASPDEFADPLDNMEPPPNLDPIFGVDLDKLTAGTGLYFMVARYAVSCHRFMLGIFYYGPLRLVQGFAAAPPMMCLVALTLRQLVGKTLLGAKGLTDAAAEKKESKDALSMAKSFITSFLGKAFPTLVSLYDAFNDLRGDMYIVLCGVFVGMALVHSQFLGLDEAPTTSTTESSSSATTDEL